MSKFVPIRLLKPGLSIFILLLCLVINTQAQEQIIVMDTSEYQPYPEGLDINLSIAASLGYDLEIKRLINLGADINNRDYIGATPLIYAVANNKKSSLESLMAYSPDLDIITNKGESALHIAAKNNNMVLAEMLIRDSADINIRGEYNCTPLHFAAAYDYFYMTDLLLYYDADIDAETTDKTTALMAAVWAGNAGIADLLIKNGANVNLADSKGFTPLLIAAQNGDTLLSRLLLDAGADISASTISKYDIGSLAAITGDLEYSKFLVERTLWLEGRKDDITDPALVARKAGHNNTYKYFRVIGNNKLPSVNFDRVSLTLSTKVNGDFYMGGQLSFTDPLLKISINTGMEFKPAYSRVLIQEAEDIFYQYADKRYILYAGLGKAFLLSENYFKGSSRIIINLNMAYMFSNYYKGTNIKPDNKMLIMPSIGVERKIDNFSIVCLYEYMNTGLYKPGAHWFKVGASYYFHFGTKVAPLKNINWY